MKMTSMNSVEALDPKNMEQPEPTEVEEKELVEQSIQKRERLAESGLDMAKLFIENGKPEIAMRRLKEIVDEFDGSAAAEEASEMLERL
jgi:Tfp pilus assembly protein FimV